MVTQSVNGRMRGALSSTVPQGSRLHRLGLNTAFVARLEIAAVQDEFAVGGRGCLNDGHDDK
jgi:hypothetical protein